VVACEESTAPYRIHRQVLAGAAPLGEFTVWSCLSAADAEQQAAAAEAQIRQGR
jgi:hypothetical protein